MSSFVCVYSSKKHTLFFFIIDCISCSHSAVVLTGPQHMRVHVWAWKERARQRQKEDKKGWGGCRRGGSKQKNSTAGTAWYYHLKRGVEQSHRRLTEEANGGILWLEETRERRRRSDEEAAQVGAQHQNLEQWWEPNGEWAASESERQKWLRLREMIQ